MADYAQGERSAEETAARKGKAKLAGEAKDRLERARRTKMEFERDMREGYFFTAPHRRRSVLSTTKPPKTKPNDAQELTTSFGFELASDFPTVIINTFLPQVEPWFVREPSMVVPDNMRDAVKKDAQAGDRKIFDAIKGSNFYAECGKAFKPDLALGTIGMWVEPRKGYQPIHCQAIPISELELNIGPDGSVADRFVVRYTNFGYLKALLPEIEFPAKIAKAIDKTPAADCIVIWGFWPLYEDDGEETWQAVVLVDGEAVGPCPKIKGAGCCPLVIARFGASPEWAWGVGPLIEGLPDLRALDEIAILKLKYLALSLSPPIGYPDDSIAHLANGIENGMAYSVRPGSEGAIKPLYEVHPQDASIYITQDLEQRLKRLFFLDWPQQRGDTPPTATQWLDEMTKAQQRIGTPGYVFWTEFCGGTVSRFQYILEQQGAIAKPALNGKSISLVPRNPAQKSAEMQDVAQFGRFAEIGNAVAPEEMKVWTDGQKTLQKLARLLNADKVWVMRDPEHVKAAVSQIAQLQQGQPGPAPPQAPGVPSGPPADLAGPAPKQPSFRATV